MNGKTRHTQTVECYSAVKKNGVEATYVFVCRGMVQTRHMQTVECHSAIERHGILPCAATQTDSVGIMSSELSQTEEDKHCVGSLT